jgi:hypothetical protein
MVISLPKMPEIHSPLFCKKIKANVKFWKIFLIMVLGIVFYYIPKDYLGETYPICLYRILFGIKCIGCGTTRALWSILHLKFKDAYEYNKLIIISFPLLVFCLIWWSFKANEKSQITI